MGLRIYIIVEEYDTTGPCQIYVMGAVMDEEIAKEIVNILNAKEREGYDEDCYTLGLPSYKYFCQEVYGTVEDFMKEIIG